MLYVSLPLAREGRPVEPNEAAIFAPAIIGSEPSMSSPPSSSERLEGAAMSLFFPLSGCGAGSERIYPSRDFASRTVRPNFRMPVRPAR